MPRPADDFAALWDRHAAGLAELADALFDDRRLNPPPPVERFLDDARFQAFSAWAKEAPADRDAWLRRAVVGALLARGWDLYSPTLAGMLRRTVWSDDDVEEILADARAASVRRLGELAAAPRSLFGWLCQLVTQQRVDWLRSTQALRRDARRTVPLATAAAADPADTGTTPTQAERRDRAARLFEQAVAGLAPEHREVLVLRVQHQMPPAEMAAVLGITDGAARTRLSRARDALLALWLAKFPDDADELRRLGLIDPPPGGAP